MYERHRQSYICDVDDPRMFFVLANSIQNMTDKQSVHHEKHAVLQRTGWMHHGGAQSFLSALPDGHPRCCDTTKLASVQTAGATAVSVPRETGLSLGVQVAGGGVSILLLNLEEETNPGSKRAMVLTETLHGDRVFKVYSPLSDSTVFIKTLHLGLSPIRREPPHGHCQSGP